MSDFELEMDSDNDEDNEMQDLQQLNAALVDDEPCSSTSVPQTNSVSTFNSKYEEYSKIETALALNKMYDDKLRRLERILQSRLQECRRRLSEIRGMASNNEKCDRTEVFRYVSCGKPYFKDKTNFPAPDNEDTILMTKYQMYDFFKTASVSGWTVKDKTQFLKMLEKMSQEKKKKDLMSQIAELKRESKIKNAKINEKKIAALHREIDRVGKLQLKDIALPLEEEYDWDSVANKLNYRHSAPEYRALWKLFLHPAINKSVWSKSETMSLQRIAHDEKLQDWEKIASLLGTGRRNYQCFVFFRTNMSNTFTGKKWTKEEEEYLKRLIEYYREDNYIPWGKVAAAMDNRTKVQIYNKYLRLMEFRKGRFVSEEDAVILTCVDKFGPNFKKISKFLPGRSVAQCRIRFQVLAKRRISIVWTIEEDRKLIQTMANQDFCINYSTLAQHFPGKDRQHIRSRYLTLSKWMRRNPNVDIAKAPRRAARRLGHGHSAGDLSRAIEGLKSRIQSEVIDKRNKKLTMNSPEGVIEDAIVALLANEDARIEKDSEHSEDEDQHCHSNKNNCNIQNLRKILILLRAKLDKKKFLESSFAKKYKELLEPERESPGKFKSYSVAERKREDPTKIVVPDIWGGQRLGPLSYVLPPHYSTITGCRKLMSYVSTKSKTNEDSINISFGLKKNLLLKDEILLLMERFNALFLWPMLLASGTPEETIPSGNKYCVKKTTKKPPNFEKQDWNAVAVPSHQLNNQINQVIDYQESVSSSDINLDSDVIFENSDLPSITFE